MSQITRCPSCATKFKVVADQLRISDGWVRCGHCKEIFDACAHLQVVEPAVLMSNVLPVTAIQAQAPALPPEPEGYELPSAQESEPDFAWTADFDEPEPEPEPELHIEPVLLDDVRPPPAMPPREALDSEELHELAQQVPVVFSAEDVEDLLSAAQGPEDGGAPELDEPAPEPSFVRAARRKAFWRKPAVRLLMSLLALLLLCALLLQVAVHERNYIAALQPQSRALLQALCGPLQCTVGAHRQIASVVVDGSSFNKVRGDSYQFLLALKNRSDIPLETPAVELTLIDAQDQPVLRRVFMPEDLAAPAELAARGDWSGTFQVRIAALNARIVGYRVLVFYP